MLVTNHPNTVYNERMKEIPTQHCHSEKFGKLIGQNNSLLIYSDASETGYGVERG